MNFPAHLVFRPGQRGVSLTIVLPVLAVLLLLIIAMLLAASYESRQATSSLDRIRAEGIARTAIDDVASKIASIPLDKHWAAAPGLIRFWDGSSWNRTIELHSGNTHASASAAAEPDLKVNLNTRLADGTHFILPENEEFPTAPAMELDWMYVLRDGSVVPGPLTAAQEPVGRYAYWVDLENARVNLNTAGFGMTRLDYHLADTPMEEIIADYRNQVWGVNPWRTDRVTINGDGVSFSPLDRTDAQRHTLQNLVGHPSSVDLSFLEGISESQSFNTFRYAGSYFLRADARNAYHGSSWEPGSQAPDTSVRFFSTPEDWKMIVGEEAYRRNKGYLTTMGRTPEINPWGLPKIALSQIQADGQAFNELSEAWWRENNGSRPFEMEKEDTRSVQIPALLPMGEGSGPQRDSFRDLTNIPYWSTNAPAIQQLMPAIKGLWETPAPGFAGNLWEKYDATPGGGERTAFDLIAFVDSGLNGLTAGMGPFSPWKDHHTHGSYQQPGTVPSLDDTIARSSNVGPFFMNELVLQAEPVRYPTLIRNNQFNSVSALWGGTNGLDYEAANAAAINNPKPKAILTKQQTSYFNIFLYLIRDIQPDDIFIRVRLRPEMMTGPAMGLRHPAMRMFGESLRIFVSNNSCQWVSDDPLSASGSLRFDLSDANMGPDNPASGYSVNSGQRQVVFLTGAVATPYPAATPGGNDCRDMGTDNYPAILVGPFAPGTLISSLKIRLQVLTTFSLWGGANSNARRMSAFPGIGKNLDPEDAGFLDEREGELLEFEFKEIDVESPIPRFSSLEVTDPRVAIRPADWKPLPEDEHTLGAENTVYETSLEEGADVSDFSRPSPLLQAVRGRLRQFANGGGGDPRPRVERQNASLILGLPGVGYLSSVPTGGASGTPWKTMQFHAGAADPPDWLLWSLFYVPFDRSIYNQSDGKLNINATLYPFGIKRRKPLEALIGSRAANPSALADAIADGPATPGLPDDLFVYPGQLCDVPGFADSGNEYSKEALPRDLADLVSTQCDDYRVFVVAQSIKRTPAGKLVPMATHRAEVTLSRTPDYGPNHYAFGEIETASYKEIPIYLRGDYEADGPETPRINAYDKKTALKDHRSPLGADRKPNTADDWIIPQRIDISSYRNVH